MATLVSMTTFPSASRAASFPDRPIKLVLPFAVGGTADLVARLLATKMQERLGQPVIVESRAGANGIIGADAVAKAIPDGYTLLLNSSAQALNESLYRKLPYDPRTAFEPVAQVVPPIPYVVAVHPSVPAKSLKDLLSYAKANPNAVSYGSAGIGNGLHLGPAMLAQRAGVLMQHIPYKGAAPALTDLLSGQIQMMFNSWVVLLPFIKNGRLRAIAQTGAARSPVIPDLPTVIELGLPGFDFTSWYGLYAPARTSPIIVDTLNATAAWAMTQPDAELKLHQIGGGAPGRMSPSAFAAFHRDSAQRFAEFLNSTGLAMDLGS